MTAPIPVSRTGATDREVEAATHAKRAALARWFFAREAPIRYWHTGALAATERDAWADADTVLALLAEQPGGGK